MLVLGEVVCNLCIHSTEDLLTIRYYTTCLLNIVSHTESVEKYSVSVGVGSNPTKPTCHHLLLSV